MTKVSKVSSKVLSKKSTATSSLKGKKIIAKPKSGKTSVAKKSSKASSVKKVESFIKPIRVFTDQKYYFRLDKKYEDW